MGLTVDVRAAFIPMDHVHMAVDIVMRDWLNYSGNIVMQVARANVTEGVGPGPHPHPEREDTGALRESIMYKISEPAEFYWMVAVGPDVKAPPRRGKTPPHLYGWFLEAGWHSRAGRLWRYPWLRPALLNSLMFVRQDLNRLWPALSSMLNRLARFT